MTARIAKSSVLLLAYNKRVYTEICLRSLYAAMHPGIAEIVVLDNGSTDDTGDFLARWAPPRLRVVRRKKNIGVARGFNLLRRQMRTDSERIIFLNNDIIFQPGWYGAMSAEMDRNKKMGIVGAKLLYPQTGNIQHAGIGLRRREEPGWFEPYHPHLNQPAETAGANRRRLFPAVTGALMMTDRRLFDRVGGWDERYWLGYEDVDYCFKCLSKGRQIAYAPRAVAYHFAAVTVSDDRSADDANLRLLNRKWSKKVFGRWAGHLTDPYAELRRHLERGKKRVVIHGTGAGAARALPKIRLMGFQVIGFCDARPDRAGVFEDLPVVGPDGLRSLRPDLVIVASMYAHDIIRKLKASWGRSMTLTAIE